jgi:hypothetical protein
MLGHPDISDDAEPLGNPGVLQRMHKDVSIPSQVRLWLQSVAVESDVAYLAV